MAVKKADLKSASVAEAKKTTETIVTDKEAAVAAGKETAPKKTAVKEAAPKKAASAKPAAKRATKKVTEKTAPKTATTAKTTAKTTATKTTTAAKTSKTTTTAMPVSKAVSNKAELYIQFAGKDIAANDLINKVKEIWTSELGNKMSTLKNLKLYMKPEEHAAYYVINDDISGRIDM